MPTPASAGPRCADCMIGLADSPRLHQCIGKVLRKSRKRRIGARGDMENRNKERHIGYSLTAPSRGRFRPPSCGCVSRHSQEPFLAFRTRTGCGAPVLPLPVSMRVVQGFSSLPGAQADRAPGVAVYRFGLSAPACLCRSFREAANCGAGAKEIFRAPGLKWTDRPFVI